MAHAERPALVFPDVVMHSVGAYLECTAAPDPALFLAAWHSMTSLCLVSRSFYSNVREPKARSLHRFLSTVPHGVVGGQRSWLAREKRRYLRLVDVELKGAPSIEKVAAEVLKMAYSATSRKAVSVTKLLKEMKLFGGVEELDFVQYLMVSSGLVFANLPVVNLVASGIVQQTELEGSEDVFADFGGFQLRYARQSTLERPTAIEVEEEEVLLHLRPLFAAVEDDFGADEEGRVGLESALEWLGEGGLLLCDGAPTPEKGATVSLSELADFVIEWMHQPYCYRD